MDTEISSILCVADMNITGILDQCLADLALPEIFIQRAKQMSLIDKQRILGLHPVTRLDESRALIYRIFVPSVYEDGLMHRIMEMTDLKMGGRGFIFSQRPGIRRGTPLLYDTEKLERLCGKSEKLHREECALISCIVPRGTGDSLARTLLELGVCVPVIFFGTGMGLRNKLGLLRITIPIEKEIIWAIVPYSESDLVEKTLIPRARLDIPGQGFLYKCNIHAPAVNLRIRQGKRDSAATMEQVIAALDEVHGSSDWRRQGSHKGKTGSPEHLHTRGLFFIGMDDEVEIFHKTAMENGARGATLNSVELRSYAADQGKVNESNSRSLCDIIITPNVEEKLLDAVSQTGLFDSGRSCLLKSINVEMPSVIRR